MLRKAISPDTAAELFGAERTLPLLRAAWPLAVGARLAQRTEVVGLEGRTLIVRVPDGRWRKILHRLRRELLQRLRETAGPRGPYALGFVEGKAAEPPPPEPAGRQRVAPLAADSVSPAIASAALDIADDEIRRLFMDAAARYLTRGRGV